MLLLIKSGELADSAGTINKFYEHVHENQDSYKSTFCLEVPRKNGKHSRLTLEVSISTINGSVFIDIIQGQLN